MKTDALIDLLARGAGPAPQRLAARRLLPALAVGAVASAGLALLLIGVVPAAFFQTAAPWVKLAYAGGLAVSGAWLVARMGQPGASTGWPTAAVGAVVGTMALVGLGALARVPSTGRLIDLLGHSWATCPWNVLGLSVPALAAALWALRGLAPTRPRRAGAAAGLFAGALGALGYALACTEASLAFVAVWYSLGIALATGLGTLLGPRLLRW